MLFIKINFIQFIYKEKSGAVTKFKLVYKKPETATADVLQKTMFLKISQNSQGNTCARVSETQAQVFSCEFCEIFNNTFFTEHLWTTASEKA